MGRAVGEHSGTFVYELRDRLGRTFRLPIVDVKWKAGDGALIYSDFTFSY
jgi:hypothetical protein